MDTPWLIAPNQEVNMGFLIAQKNTCVSDRLHWLSAAESLE